MVSEFFRCVFDFERYEHKHAASRKIYTNSQINASTSCQMCLEVFGAIWQYVKAIAKLFEKCSKSFEDPPSNA
jgi:hypothetical protein